MRKEIGKPRFKVGENVKIISFRSKFSMSGKILKISITGNLRYVYYIMTMYKEKIWLSESYLRKIR